MSINLLESVQKNLGYPPLQKIDPNTEVEKKSSEDSFGQAAIPAVLTGLYKFSQSDEGAVEILQDNNPVDWADEIFFDRKEAVIKAISDHSNESNGDTISKINIIANEAVKIVKENLHKNNADIKELKKFFSNQRNNILLYLLPVLNMGDLLHDDTLDDNTNKMEGPISSLMQSIGSAFSNPVTDDEIKK